MLLYARRARFLLLSVLLAFVAFAPGWAGADDRRIVVFGTSLSDPGNFFALTGRSVSPPDYGMGPEDFLVPDAPYANGSNHFSNGPTWIEQLARPLGLSSNVRPAMAGSDGRASNYAVGGARARDDGTPIHLSVQVQAFLRDSGRRVPSHALYVIEMGGNDVRDAIAQANPALLHAAVDAIEANIRALHRAGARNFLVWNAPDLSLTPAIRALGTLDPRVPVFAQQLSAGFNASLSARLDTLSKLRGIDIARFDSFGALHGIVAMPAAYGLSDVSTACIMPNVPPYQCALPDRHLFWDGIHPTQAGHRIIAFLAAKVVIREIVLDD